MRVAPPRARPVPEFDVCVLETALEMYVRDGWTVSDLAEHLACEVRVARDIVRGDLYPYIARPDNLRVWIKPRRGYQWWTHRDPADFFGPRLAAAIRDP